MAITIKYALLKMIRRFGCPIKNIQVSFNRDMKWQTFNSTRFKCGISAESECQNQNSIAMSRTHAPSTRQMESVGDAKIDPNQTQTIQQKLPVSALVVSNLHCIPLLFGGRMAAVSLRRHCYFSHVCCVFCVIKIPRRIKKMSNRCRGSFFYHSILTGSLSNAMAFPIRIRTAHCRSGSEFLHTISISSEKPFHPKNTEHQLVYAVEV